MDDEKFNFKFLNSIMYIGALVAVFYILQNLGILGKLGEILVALIPVYVGIIICWLSMPLANKLKKLGMKNRLASVIALIIIFGVLAVLITLVVPIIFEEITKLIVDLPNLYSNAVNKINTFLFEKFSIDPTQGIGLSYSQKTIDLIKQNLDNILNYSISTLKSVGNVIIGVFTAIIVAFFLVKDMDMLKEKTLLFFSKNDKNSKRYRMLSDVDDAILNYVRGIVIDSIIVGIITTIACYILGLDYAIIFGLLIMVLNLIPYIGAFISEGIIALYALSTGGIGLAIITLIVMVSIQIIDSNILQPNIVAKSVKIHPVIILVGLIVFELMFGFVGMIIAVPVIAGSKVILEYTLFNKKIEKEHKK